MPYTLRFHDGTADDAVPEIPAQPGAGARRAALRPERLEHFGTEALALRRVGDLLPAPAELALRLYGPDGGRIATQSELAARLGLTVGSHAASDDTPMPDGA